MTRWVFGRRAWISLMRSIAELRDQLADAQAALVDEERELRRAELLVEKEGGSAAVAAAGQLAPHGAHVR